MTFQSSPVWWVLFCFSLAFATLANAAGGGAAPAPAPARPAPAPAPAPPSAPKPPSPPSAPKPPAPPSAPKPPVSPPRVPGKPNPPRIIVLPAPEHGVVDDDAASVFSLGSFKDDEQVLFENFDGPTVPFFSKMYDFFAAKETYIGSANAYAEATGKENPFNDGRPTGQRLSFTRTVKSPTAHVVTATFDPSKPTDVCRAWTSLATYCGDSGAACACYSGTYYVPDQWNSLAAGCAVLTTRCTGSTEDPWCQIGKTASEYTSYCTDDAEKVKFAARANIKTPTAQSGAGATPIVDTIASLQVASQTTVRRTSTSQVTYPTGSTSYSSSASSQTPSLLKLLSRYSYILISCTLILL